MRNQNFKPKSIENEGGIKLYLKNSRSLHNDYDGDDLAKFVAAKVPVAVIGRLMSNNPSESRSVNTVKSWIALLEKSA